MNHDKELTNQEFRNTKAGCANATILKRSAGPSRLLTAYDD